MKSAKSIALDSHRCDSLHAFSFLASLASYAMADEKEQVIQITAKRFEYSPNNITVKKGIPVSLGVHFSG